MLTTNRFEKDLKPTLKLGKDLDKLWKIIELLLDKKPLENVIDRILYQATMKKHGNPI